MKPTEDFYQEAFLCIFIQEEMKCVNIKLFRVIACWPVLAFERYIR